MTTTRIYVACLASYNSGVSHGAWIDCEGKTADDIQDETNAMLRASLFPNVTVEFEGATVPSAEEWAIHDHEGLGTVAEYESFEDIAIIAEALNGDYALGFLYLRDDVGLSASDALDKAANVMIFQDETSCGDKGLMKDYAFDWVAECMSEALAALPEILQGNIDYAGIAYDWECNGDICMAEHNGERFLVTNANSL